MSLAQVTKKSNTKTVIVDTANTSHLTTPDDTFDHKYSMENMDLEEKFQEYLSYNGLDGRLLSELKAGDLNEFAKSMSSEYSNLKYKYKRKVKAIYRNSTVTYHTVAQSDSD